MMHRGIRANDCATARRRPALFHRQRGRRDSRTAVNSTATVAMRKLRASGSAGAVAITEIHQRDLGIPDAGPCLMAKRRYCVFEVDRTGLRMLLERKGKEFALYELVQNSWDQNVKEVKVTFTKPPGGRLATLKVEDDDPDGFADPRHAYTLFASSPKKSNPRQRGRFNIGEKLVIAICEESRIVTTKGGVEFVGNERRTLRQRLNRGSVFEGSIRLTRPEFEECCEAMRRLIPPVGVNTYFNGELVPHREPIAVIEHIPLRTEIADAEGYLRPTTRHTEIRIYELLQGETGTLYEMGIPVVETGDDYHVDVQQKVPLNSDRDNVPPSYLLTIRTAVLNETHSKIDQEAANHVWVRQAMEDPDVSEGAVCTVIRKRFGEKVVSFDPSDLEANNRAVANGFTVVHGRSLSKAEWENVRRTGAVPSAGSLFRTNPGEAKPVIALEPAPNEQRIVNAMNRLAQVIIGRSISITLFSDMADPAEARYGGGSLLLNKVRLGREFFDELNERVVDLLLHELGHECASNHLSDDYYQALSSSGARLAFAVAKDPSLLLP